MPTSKPAPSSTLPCKSASDDLFDLPEVPAEYCEPSLPPPSWQEQMAHAQMLLAWRKAQGMSLEDPPRNLARFVAV